MPKWSNYQTRFAVLACVGVLLTSVVAFSLATYFFNDTYNRSLRQSLTGTLQTGEALLDGYASGQLDKAALREKVNPAFGGEGLFLMLMDSQGHAIAYTDSAVPYLAANAADRLISRLREGQNSSIATVSEEGSTALIAGRTTANGMVLAGKTLSPVSSAGAFFRSRFLPFMLFFIAAALLLSSMATRLTYRPMRILTDAAEKLADGEQVLLPENMSGDMNNIAVAFNHMSRTIAASIQELRLEKETLSLILESMSDGLYALDEDGQVLQENPAARQLLGNEQSPAARRVAQALRAAAAHPDDPPAGGLIEQGGRTLEYAVSPLPSSPPRRRSALALIRDVTEQERLEHTRRDYVANISHELRTPLASMRGLAEGLRDGLVTDPEERMRCYTIIVDEVTRLSRLVNDLLELSGLQSNPAAFEMEKVDPGDLVWDLHDRNASLFEKSGLSFSFSLPEEPLPMVRSNEDRLAQVLTIFLDNARKYTPAGGTVALGAERAADGVRFYVRDNGIGMDEETQRLAFDRFHQAERSHAGKGSGLGLAIAREIMQKLNVPIALTSAPGKGSEFSFVIPLTSPEPAGQGKD